MRSGADETQESSKSERLHNAYGSIACGRPKSVQDGARPLRWTREPARRDFRAADSFRKPVMSKLPQVALSLAFAGTLPLTSEADYRSAYTGPIARPGCCGRGFGPVAPPMFPMTTGVPISPGGTCCGHVIAPAMPMVSASPIILPPTTCCAPALQPMVHTHLRPQQIVTYQDIPRTTIRREAVQVQVPVTTYRQMTVTVPQTVMQQQVQYREIPVQTTERVQQVRTVLVPEQQIRYVQSGIYVPQTASTILGPTAEAMPTISVPTPPQTSQLPSEASRNGGLEWQPVKPRLAPDNKTSALEPGRTRAAGRFSPVSLPRTADDIQTALAD